MTVNKERVELLAQALESDQFQQCMGALRRQQILLGTWTHCALGVAIQTALNNGHQLDPVDLEMGEEWIWEAGTLPDSVMSWYGFDDNDPTVSIDEGDGPFDASVAAINDDGTDFWTIAQALRATYLKGEE